MNDVVLGIDLGTGSSKAVLADRDGRIIASRTVARPDPVSMPRAGQAEVDAEAVWWQDVVRLCREMLRLLGATRLAGVCVSGVGPCFLICDEQDRPLRPAILYGIDTRATQEIDELDQRYGKDRILARGGSALSSQAVGPKALWLRRHEPETWTRATRWYNAHSFIVRRLTGEYVLDQHTASQCDPLYDISAQSWYEPWYQDVMGHLPAPRLLWPGEIAGMITGEAAELTGLPPGTPVMAGTIDAWAEAFSVGVRKPGQLMLMYGSTMFFVQGVKDIVPRPDLWTTAGVDPGSRTLAAGMSTSGSITGWFQEFVGGVPFTDLVDEAAKIPPGSSGLLVLPYFAGERTPIFDPRARGVIAGLSLRHTRAHVFRAIYEGVAFGVRQVIELLDNASPIAQISAVGGGTQGGLWTQIVSDVTGRDQLISAQTIGASYGDAMLAAIGTGLLGRDQNWTVTDHVVTPNPENSEIYQELYRSYCDLYPATRLTAHRLARLQEADVRA